MIKTILGILKTLFSSFLRQVGVHLKEEVDKNLAELKEGLIQKFSGLENAAFVKSVITLLKTALTKAWVTIVSKYNSDTNVGFFKKLVFNIVSPIVVNEISKLDKYQPILEDFVSKQATDKVTKVVGWIDAEVDKLINKLFGCRE